MSEQNQQPSVNEQLEGILRRMEELLNRVERIEERLGMEEPEPHPPAPSPTKRGGATFTFPAAPSQPTSPEPTPTPSPPVVPPPPFIPPTPEELRQRVTAAPTSAPSQPSASGRTTPIRPTSPPPPPPTSGGAERTTGEWEAIFGGKLALWIGLVLVFFATAFFLAWAWQYIPPNGRVGLGFLAGFIFLGLGGWSHGRSEHWFSEGMTGAGLAIFYLSIWAGAQRYQLLPFEPAFALMAITTALGVGLALRYDAISLSLLATTGGFLTPALLRASGGGESQAMPFLTYIAVLDAGILAVSLYKRWQGIIWLSFIATMLLLIGWAVDSYHESLRVPVFTFVSLYFLLFLGAACFYSLKRREPTEPEDLLLLFANTFVYALAGYALLEGATGDYPGAFPLALAVFFALLELATHSLVPENRTLRDSTAGLSVFFLTITVPIQLKQGFISIAWSMEAAVLVTLALRFSSALLHRAGQVVWGLSIFALLWILLEVQPARGLLFLNERALPLLISLLATGWMAFITGIRDQGIKDSNTSSPNTQPSTPNTLTSIPLKDELSPFYVVYVILGGAWLIAQETYLGFSWRWIPSQQTWRASALFIIACLWAVYALAMFGVGLALRQAVVRFSAFTVAMLAMVIPVWGSATLPTTGWTPFWNLRWLAYLVVAATMGLLAWMLSKEREQLEPSEADAMDVLPVLVSVLVLWGVSVEIYSGFRFWAYPSADAWDIVAFFVIATVWSVFAVGLLLFGLLWEQMGLRVLAYMVGGIGTLLLLFTTLEASSLDWSPVLNLRFFAFAVVVAMLGIGATLIQRRGKELNPVETQLASGTGFLALMLLLWGLTQETYETCRYYRASLGEHWERWAQMAISLVWTLFGAMTLIGGILRHCQPIRLLALGLLGLTVLKVFLFDLSFLDTPLRVLSFGGLGIALIFISWLYSRYGIGRESETRSG